MKTKRKRVEKRSNQRNWQLRQKAAGLCLICPNRADINPRTGKPFKYCAHCRTATNAQQAALMRRRRRAGIA